jgi:hypothetical protein
MHNPPAGAEALAVFLSKGGTIRRVPPASEEKVKEAWHKALKPRRWDSAEKASAREYTQYLLDGGGDE